MKDGMDAQYEDLKRFHSDLIEFEKRLRASVSDLEGCLEQVSPHWRDEMRRQFDQLWAPFREEIGHFARSEGPAYVEFITLKIHQTSQYLRQR